jgi:hypothetical protein
MKPGRVFVTMEQTCRVETQGKFIDTMNRINVFVCVSAREPAIVTVRKRALTETARIDRGTYFFMIESE